MSGDVHARFWESPGVRFPRATHRRHGHSFRNIEVTEQCLPRADVKHLLLEPVLYAGLFEHGYLELRFARGEKIDERRTLSS